MPSSQDNNVVADADAGDVLLKPAGDAVAFNSANSDGVTLPMMGTEESPASVLETIEERKARRRSHYVVYFTTFIGSVGFSIVLTGVWPYLQQLDAGVSKEFLGWVIAVNPLGQMITSPLLGLWANKAGSSRGPLLFAVTIFILGNALYAILSIFGSSARAMMVFARFLVGVSFANMAIIRSYVAASTTMAERTSAVAFTSAAQGCGFIIGPALQAAVAVAFSRDKETQNVTVEDTLVYQVEDEEFGVEWNMYTAAGWSAVFLGFINFFLFLPCIFQEHPVAAKEAQLQKSAASENNTELPKPDYVTVISLLVSFFIVQFVFVLIEVLLVPLCIDMYAWSDEATLTIVGIGLCVAGIVATIMFASVGTLARKFDERKIYIGLGLIPLLLSMACFFPVGNTYPKIQNCTSETNPVRRDTRSIPTLLNNLETLKSSVNPSYYAEVFQVPLTKLLNERKKVSKPKIIEMDEDNLIHLYLGGTFLDYEDDRMFDIDSNHGTPSTRKQRSIRQREKKCKDLGCPPEQEWCQYTPIIELPQLVVACFIAFIGYPVAFSLSNSLFSKLLGPKPQGVWMGILTSIGSFSRMTGPVFVSYMYTAVGTRWTFGFLFFVMIFTVVLMLIFYKRLVPMKVTSS